MCFYPELSFFIYSHYYTSFIYVVLILSSHLHLALSCGVFPVGFTISTLKAAIDSPILDICPFNIIFVISFIVCFIYFRRIYTHAQTASIVWAICTREAEISDCKQVVHNNSYSKNWGTDAVSIQWALIFVEQIYIHAMHTHANVRNKIIIKLYGLSQFFLFSQTSMQIIHLGLKYILVNLVLTVNG